MWEWLSNLSWYWYFPLAGMTVWLALVLFCLGCYGTAYLSEATTWLRRRMVSGESPNSVL
jgi:hypothetical protein